MLCFGWTEQKNGYPFVPLLFLFLACFALRSSPQASEVGLVCVFLTNCIWFCVQLFYSVFKVLPKTCINGYISSRRRSDEMKIYFHFGSSLVAITQIFGSPLLSVQKALVSSDAWAREKPSGAMVERV